MIRQVVRDNIAQVRSCYNAGLELEPDLEGRVLVQFVISPAGTVRAAVVAQTSLPSEHHTVADCIADAVSGWTFPVPPGSGNAIVSYPFLLAPR